MLHFQMGHFYMALISVLKKQPLVAPNDIRRYFVTPQESGELCV